MDIGRWGRRLEDIASIERTSLDDLSEYILNNQRRDAKQLRDVVPIDEWLRSPYYLGPESQTLYPFWEDVLVDFNRGNFNELILGGSLRSGKSTAALIQTVRVIYELSCFSPIPAIYGLSISSQLLMMYLSINLKQANRAGMGRIRRMIDGIPYFQDYFKRDRKVDSFISFEDPNLAMYGGSELGHFKGSDLILLIFDEANFTKGAQEDKIANATEIYREATSRRKMTFMVDGVESGIGIIISSADVKLSFVEERKKQAETNPRSMIVDAVQYEVQPWKYRGVKRFWVFKGDDTIDPFMVKKDKQALANYIKVNGLEMPLKNFKVKKLPPDMRMSFVNPPKTFEDLFETDLFGSLRDICGIPIGQEGRFFTNRVKFAKCFPKKRRDAHPFWKESIVVSYLDTAQIMDSLIEDRLKINPSYEYFAGIDQSLTNDDTGISLCHIDPTREELKIEYDFTLRITAPKKPDEISPGKIVEFFVWLKKTKGANILKAYFDWYATSESKQKLKVHGIDADKNSVDKDWDAYRSFAGNILNLAVSGYHYKPFKDELFALVQDNEKRKVDHQVGGSKDVCDGMVQSHQAAMERYLEIKRGIVFFPNFAQANVMDFQYESGLQVVCGIYFGPETFYAAWMFARNNPATGHKDVFVFHEMLSADEPDERRAEKLRQASENMPVIYSGDPGEYKRADVTGATPDKRYRQLGIPVRVRRNIDRDNMNLIRRAIFDGSERHLFIKESGAPMMAMALRKARFKVINNVRTKDLDMTGEQYPIYALRFALEDIFIVPKISSY